MDIISDVRGLVDQLNPLSRQNQILFFFWLFGYFFLMAGIWRCERRGIRFCFLVVHQLFSAGVFISQVNIVVLAIYLWIESLAIVLVASALAMLMFRRRRPRQPPEEADPGPDRAGEDGSPPALTPPSPQLIEKQAETLTSAWHDRQAKQNSERS